MSKIGRAKIVLLIPAITIASILYLFKWECVHHLSVSSANHDNYQEYESERVSSGEYVVYNPRCRIPEMQIWDKSIRRYFKGSSLLRCSKRPLLTSVVAFENGTSLLKIEKPALKHYIKGSTEQAIRCCFSKITRITESPENYDTEADSKFRYSKCTDFQNEILFTDDTEFIRVICKVKGKMGSGKEVYRDAHPLVPMLPSALKKLSKLSSDDSVAVNGKSPIKYHRIGDARKRLNVMIVGIDSVSRLNLRRMMPETYRHLAQNKWLELAGYTKIADNTLPNLMAILTGRNMSDLGDLCLRNRSKSIDDCPYIWKQFSDANYVTAYGEDTPNIATFNYLKTGFVNKPTDYYLRPFMLAVHSSLAKKKVFGLPVCVGPVTPVDHILNYARRFLKTSEDRFNHFSLFWMNSLSHNDPSMAKNMDQPILRFLRDLSDFGTYRNTVIFLLSDHGTRFGDFRHTFIGYYEERLPFVFVWFPEWFRKEYPHLYANLLINQRRLTSPYDIHLTLLKILHTEFSDTPRTRTLPVCPGCVSLFERVPWNRGCSEAAISPAWCMCDEFKPVTMTQGIISRLGKFVMKTVDTKTKKLVRQQSLNDSVCATWKFRKVIRAHRVVSPREDRQRNVTNQINNIYMVLVELDPGKTKFEASVEVTQTVETLTEQFSIKSSPSRLDGYSKFSECVSSPNLKYYCYCTTFVK